MKSSLRIYVVLSTILNLEASDVTQSQYLYPNTQLQGSNGYIPQRTLNSPQLFNHQVNPNYRPTVQGSGSTVTGYQNSVIKPSLYGSNVLNPRSGYQIPANNYNVPQTPTLANPLATQIQGVNSRNDQSKIKIIPLPSGTSTLQLPLSEAQPKYKVLHFSPLGIKNGNNVISDKTLQVISKAESVLDQIESNPNIYNLNDNLQGIKQLPSTDNIVNTPTLKEPEIGIQKSNNNFQPTYIQYVNQAPSNNGVLSTISNTGTSTNSLYNNDYGVNNMLPIQGNTNLQSATDFDNKYLKPSGSLGSNLITNNIYPQINKETYQSPLLSNNINNNGAVTPGGNTLSKNYAPQNDQNYPVIEYHYTPITIPDQVNQNNDAAPLGTNGLLPQNFNSISVSYKKPGEFTQQEKSNNNILPVGSQNNGYSDNTNNPLIYVNPYRISDMQSTTNTNKNVNIENNVVPQNIGNIYPRNDLVEIQKVAPLQKPNSGEQKILPTIPTPQAASNIGDHSMAAPINILPPKIGSIYNGNHYPSMYKGLGVAPTQYLSSTVQQSIPAQQTAINTGANPTLTSNILQPQNRGNTNYGNYYPTTYKDLGSAPTQQQDGNKQQNVSNQKGTEFIDTSSLNVPSNLEPKTISNIYNGNNIFANNKEIEAALVQQQINHGHKDVTPVQPETSNDDAKSTIVPNSIGPQNIGNMYYGNYYPLINKNLGVIPTQQQTGKAPQDLNNLENKNNANAYYGNYNPTNYKDLSEVPTYQQTNEQQNIVHTQQQVNYSVSGTTPTSYELLNNGNNYAGNSFSTTDKELDTALTQQQPIKDQQSEVPPEQGSDIGSVQSTTEPNNLEPSNDGYIYNGNYYPTSNVYTTPPQQTNNIENIISSSKVPDYNNNKFTAAQNSSNFINPDNNYYDYPLSQDLTPTKQQINNIEQNAVPNQQEISSSTTEPLTVPIESLPENGGYIYNGYYYPKNYDDVKAQSTYGEPKRIQPETGIEPTTTEKNNLEVYYKGNGYHKEIVNPVTAQEGIDNATTPNSSLFYDDGKTYNRDLYPQYYDEHNANLSQQKANNLEQHFVPHQPGDDNNDTKSTTVPNNSSSQKRGYNYAKNYIPQMYEQLDSAPIQQQNEKQYKLPTPQETSYGRDTFSPSTGNSDPRKSDNIYYGSNYPFRYNNLKPTQTSQQTGDREQNKVPKQQNTEYAEALYSPSDSNPQNSSDIYHGNNNETPNIPTQKETDTQKPVHESTNNNNIERPNNLVPSSSESPNDDYNYVYPQNIMPNTEQNATPTKEETADDDRDIAFPQNGTRYNIAPSSVATKSMTQKNDPEYTEHLTKNRTSNNKTNASTSISASHRAPDSSHGHHMPYVYGNRNKWPEYRIENNSPNTVNSDDPYSNDEIFNNNNGFPNNYESYIPANHNGNEPQDIPSYTNTKIPETTTESKDLLNATDVMSPQDPRKKNLSPLISSTKPQQNHLPSNSTHNLQTANSKINEPVFPTYYYPANEDGNNPFMTNKPNYEYYPGKTQLIYSYPRDSKLVFTPEPNRYDNDKDRQEPNYYHNTNFDPNTQDTSLQSADLHLTKHYTPLHPKDDSYPTQGYPSYSRNPKRSSDIPNPHNSPYFDNENATKPPKMMNPHKLNPVKIPHHLTPYYKKNSPGSTVPATSTENHNDDFDMSEPRPPFQNTVSRIPADVKPNVVPSNTNAQAKATSSVNMKPQTGVKNKIPSRPQSNIHNPIERYPTSDDSFNNYPFNQAPGNHDVEIPYFDNNPTNHYPSHPPRQDSFKDYPPNYNPDIDYPKSNPNNHKGQPSQNIPHKHLEQPHKNSNPGRIPQENYYPYNNGNGDSNGLSITTSTNEPSSVNTVTEKPNNAQNKPCDKETKVSETNSKPSTRQNKIRNRLHNIYNTYFSGKPSKNVTNNNGTISEQDPNTVVVASEKKPSALKVILDIIGALEDILGGD